MEFFERHRLIKKVLMALVLIAVCPFAGELLIIAEFAGTEIAFSCFLILIKPCSDWLSPRIDNFFKTTNEIKKTFKFNIIQKPKVFFIHALASSFLLILTSSAIFALCIWLPLAVSLEQMI